jgi:hypothetical protein
VRAVGGAAFGSSSRPAPPRIGAAGTPSASKRRRRGKGSITDGLRCLPRGLFHESRALASLFTILLYLFRDNRHDLLFCLLFWCVGTRFSSAFEPLNIKRSEADVISSAYHCENKPNFLMAHLIIYSFYNACVFNITNNTSSSAVLKGS